MTHTQAQTGVEPTAKNTLLGAGGSLAQVTGPASHPSHCPSRGEPHPFPREIFSNSFHLPPQPSLMLPYGGLPANPTSQAKFTVKLNPGEAQSWHWGWMTGEQGPFPHCPHCSRMPPASEQHPCPEETASHGVTGEASSCPHSPQSPPSREEAWWCQGEEAEHPRQISLVSGGPLPSSPRLTWPPAQSSAAGGPGSPAPPPAAGGSHPAPPHQGRPRSGGPTR